MFCSKVVLVLFVVPIVCVLAVRPRYQHFEDYLNNLDSNEQSWIAESNEENNTDDSTADNNNNNSDRDDVPPSSSTSTTTTTTRAPYIQESSGKSKDVTCCMLGQLAGDKGYHCYTQYYAARLIMRNRNRAHNRKMAFYGPQRIQNYGEKLMRTFEQCVAGRGPIFHKCCHLASTERRVERFDTVQQTRYQRVRHHQQQTQHQDEDEDTGDEEKSS